MANEVGSTANLAAGVKVDPPRPEPDCQGQPAEPDGRRLVLIVEDDPGDRRLIEKGFQDCTEDVDLRFANDGEEALERLMHFRRFPGIEEKRPDLVILDLGIPRLDGRRLLKEIRDDEVLKPLPVVVLTGSRNVGDIDECYRLGANTYLSKPDSVDGYRKIIRTIELYWLRRAELPPS